MITWTPDGATLRGHLPGDARANATAVVIQTGTTLDAAIYGHDREEPHARETFTALIGRLDHKDRDRAKAWCAAQMRRFER